MDTGSDVSDVSSCVPFTAEATFRIIGIPDFVGGRVEGADLDGHDTIEGSSEGCGLTDGVDPVDRRRGIDNQLAVLKPTFDGFLDEPIDDVIRARDIQLQVRVEPSSSVDTCVRVTVEIDETIASGEGRVDEDGNVRAALDGRWRPVGLLAETEPWDIGDLSIRVDRDMTRAVLAGSTDVRPWIVIVGMPGMEDIPEIRAAAVEGVHDLPPSEDGVCRAMSLGFVAEAL